MRLDLDEDKDPGIEMSSLIDCVFLLLIFFLVTTMMKKWESQIPLKLPPMTSSLSAQRSSENVEVIALGSNERVYEVVSHDAYSGETVYRSIANLESYLSQLIASRGTEIPLEIAAERNVPVEKVIEIFDICKNTGFVQTRVRLGSDPSEITAEQ